MDKIREQIKALRHVIIVDGLPLCSPNQDMLDAADTIERLLAFYEEADGIIAESHGVDGWHLNGDVASWAEFSDLIAASNAIEAVKADEDKS